MPIDTLPKKPISTVYIQIIIGLVNQTKKKWKSSNPIKKQIYFSHFTHLFNIFCLDKTAFSACSEKKKPRNLNIKFLMPIS